MSEQPQQWPEPQTITEAHKTGDRFLVWCAYPDRPNWAVAFWAAAEREWVCPMPGSKDLYVAIGDSEITLCVPLLPDPTGKGL
jgi:hypothetical protein